MTCEPRPLAGAFEEANAGTLSLDEISELPLDLQPRLLRASKRGGSAEMTRTRVLHVSGELHNQMPS